jgi:6-phosphofructo-2-kinase / fructose-2,6-biphosphatase 1
LPPNRLRCREYRRRHLGAEKRSDFFDTRNKEALEQRQSVAEKAFQDMHEWIVRERGQVAVFDATNTTRERRTWVHDACVGLGLDVFFIESVCNDDSQIQANILAVKVSSEDYRNRPSEEAIADFQRRIKFYEEAYEPLDAVVDRRFSFIKLLTAERQFIVNNIEGYLQTRIVYYLMNLRINQGTIYLTRHGESEYNLHGRIGGDSNLSERGWSYAHNLAVHFQALGLSNLSIWTSTLRRTQQTAHFFGKKTDAWKALDEIDAGVCDGMTYEEIAEKFPEEFARRDDDKYNYRYPGGESYRDLVARLEPVIMELERTTAPVLVIAHQALLRCLLAYFLDKRSEELPYISVPLHTVFKLTPGGHGYKMEEIQLSIDAVSTYRGKPADTSIHRSREAALVTVPAHE